MRFGSRPLRGATVRLSDCGCRVCASAERSTMDSGASGTATWRIRTNEDCQVFSMTVLWYLGDSLCGRYTKLACCTPSSGCTSPERRRKGRATLIIFVKKNSILKCSPPLKASTCYYYSVFAKIAPRTRLIPSSSLGKIR